MADPTTDDMDELNKPPYGTVVRGQFVSVQDAEEFMAEVFKNKKCPWCESDVWDLILRATDLDLAQEDGYVVFTTEHYVGDADSDGISARPPSPAFTYPMFLVICDACGFTRTHSIMSLQRWKAKRESGDEGHTHSEAE